MSTSSIGPSSVSTMPLDTRSQPAPIAARTGAGSDSRFDDVFDEVDDQRVMMPVQLDDGRLADAVRAIGRAKLQRAHADR